jgi:hypothetical protein
MAHDENLALKQNAAQSLACWMKIKAAKGWAYYCRAQLGRFQPIAAPR